MPAFVHGLIWTENAALGEFGTGEKIRLRKMPLLSPAIFPLFLLD
jgi:hypothetical protein